LIEAIREAIATRDTWARLAELDPEQMQDETSGSSEATVVVGTPDDWSDAELFRRAG
jgi:hypothetical protein